MAINKSLIRGNVVIKRIKKETNRNSPTTARKSSRSVRTSDSERGKSLIQLSGRRENHFRLRLIEPREISSSRQISVFHEMETASRIWIVIMSLCQHQTNMVSINIANSRGIIIAMVNQYRINWRIAILKINFTRLIDSTYHFIGSFYNG